MGICVGNGVGGLVGAVDLATTICTRVANAVTVLAEWCFVCLELVSSNCFVFVCQRQ